ALIGAGFPGDDVGRMLSSARRAWELEAGRQSPWSVSVHVMLGFALVRCGQFDEAREPLLLGADLATAAGLWMGGGGARALLARLDLETRTPAPPEAAARDALPLPAPTRLPP